MCRGDVGRAAANENMMKLACLNPSRRIFGEKDGLILSELGQNSAVEEE